MSFRPASPRPRSFLSAALAVASALLVGACSAEAVDEEVPDGDAREETSEEGLARGTPPLLVATACIEEALTSDLRTLRVGVKMSRAQASTCAQACRAASLSLRLVQGKLLATTEKLLADARAILAGRAPLPSYTIPALAPTVPARKVTMADIRALVAALEETRDDLTNVEAVRGYDLAASTFARLSR